LVLFFECRKHKHTQGRHTNTLTQMRGMKVSSTKRAMGTDTNGMPFLV